ncbi:MAG: hypothetical protein V1729_05500 [Candidatus Woesearchaeota archaeon]
MKLRYLAMGTVEDNSAGKITVSKPRDVYGFRMPERWPGTFYVLPEGVADGRYEFQAYQMLKTEKGELASRKLKPEDPEYQNIKTVVDFYKLGEGDDPRLLALDDVVRLLGIERGD